MFGDAASWVLSLGYFCSLGAIRYLLGEYFKENLLLMSTGDVSTGNLNNITDSTLTSHMNNSNPVDSNSTRPDLDNSSTVNASADSARLTLENRIAKIDRDLGYLHQQLEQSKADFEDIQNSKELYFNNGWVEEWTRQRVVTESALKDTKTNYDSAVKARSSLQKDLDMGNYTTTTASSSKRSHSEFSLDNGDSSRYSKTNQRYN